MPFRRYRGRGVRERSRADDNAFRERAYDSCSFRRDVRRGKRGDAVASAAAGEVVDGKGGRSLRWDMDAQGGGESSLDQARRWQGHDLDRSPGRERLLGRLRDESNANADTRLA